jgi:glycosyltransferase involved in cell wall biosynthesis
VGLFADPGGHGLAAAHPAIRIRVEPSRISGRMSAVLPKTITVDARMIDASGIGTYISELLPRLTAERPGVQWVILGPGPLIQDHSWARASNVRVIHFDSPIYSLREQIGLARRIPRETSLFWAPHYNIPLAWRGRLVVTVHDVAHLALPEFFSGLHRQGYARFMFRRIRRSADGIMTVSEFTRTEFKRLVGLSRVSPDVVHIGVDQSWFQVAPSPTPHPKPYLLYVGNVKPHKNLSRLLDAFGKLATRIPCDLLILGKTEGFRTGDSEVQAAASRLAPRVQLLGAVSHGLLKRYMAHAEALVLPSLYEGFGLPPLEAMACGCPTIVSRAASLPEVCGDAAQYCDPLDPASIAEAIMRVLQDSTLRETLRCRGLERARQFSWPRSARGTLSVLDRVLAA